MMHLSRRTLARSALGLLSSVFLSGGARAQVAPGGLVINEIMQDPGAVSDANGEYVELFNRSAVDLDINGWVLADLGTNRHVINHGSALIVPAGGFLVLGRNADQGSNGGVPVGYVYSGFDLANADDEVTLSDASGVLWDAVAYDGGLSFPDPTAASMQLDPAFADPAANDDGGRWCATTDVFGAGDRGSPGAPNASCGSPDPEAAELRFIHEVQGSGGSVAITGAVTIAGIVTSRLERADALDGFFVQEEDADADANALTSEGIFVFCRGRCPAALAVGDAVTVSGAAVEFFGMSQLDASASSATVRIDSHGHPLPAPIVVRLPAPGSTRTEATFEPLEGMLVVFEDELVVSEYFELARYGQLVLTDSQRPYQFTHHESPSAAGYAAFLADLARRRIILDDDNNDQNGAISGAADEPYYYPSGGLSLTRRFRGGDSIAGLTGVLHWSFAGQTGTDAWRVRPIPERFSYTFASNNPRPPAPASRSRSVRVASFNVLNYFATLDRGGAVCGPSLLECRGADSSAELARQRDKIVAALAEIDADVIGLIEIENDAGEALLQLAEALNAALGPGTYDFVDTGPIGGDAIKVAFMYKPERVALAGDFAILDSSVDPRFRDDRNRPALAQSFDDLASGERFTVAVNHLKSKGSACDDIGDPDLGDGQGNCNGTRTAAAAALADWLASDPTASGDEDVLIIGDLNAHRLEHPLTTLTAAGYTDLIERFEGDGAYTYVFDGQLGYLDHALASASLSLQVTGATVWHINADEPPAFDYEDAVQDGSEAAFERKSSALPLYTPDAYRASDHDPLLVDLSLDTPPEEPQRFCRPHRFTRRAQSRER